TADLHEFCATCPSVAQSALHPKHPLTLVNQPVNDRFCDLCRDLVHGLFCACEGCEFDVHLLCKQLPLHVCLPQHPQHLLKLQPGNPAACALCRQICTSWRDDDQTPSAPPPQPHLNRSFSTLPSHPQPHLNRSLSTPPGLQQQQQMGYGGSTVGISMGGGGGGGGYNMNYGMPSPEMMMMMNNQSQAQMMTMMMMIIIISSRR
ncbi:hypothetical protein MIMGU_mgv1a020100mg, partial [Erythranthe guttata]